MKHSGKAQAAVFISIILVIIVVVLLLSAPAVSNLSCEKIPSQNLRSQRALGVVIKDGQVLSVRLGGEAERNFSPPGGHVDPGETPRQALIREFKEELGVTISSENISPYKIMCNQAKLSADRTSYFFVDNWQGTISLKNPTDTIKWVDSLYIINNKADTELVELLQQLQNDQIIR